jgi:hypothetical protein
VVKREILSPCWESNPGCPAIFIPNYILVVMLLWLSGSGLSPLVGLIAADGEHLDSFTTENFLNS